MWVCVCVVLAPFHNARSRRNCIFIAARCLYVLKSVLYLLFIYGLLLSAFLFSPLFASLLALPSLFFSRQLCRFLSKVLCFFVRFAFPWGFCGANEYLKMAAHTWDSSAGLCMCVWILGLAEITTGTDIVRSLETICMILKVLLRIQKTR